ncbi:MAG: hypothetical protein KAX49_16345, partial [Halanaerobiales bacterium]|nr:hypothetical protein [Halanaerobiales bacterium]
MECLSSNQEIIENETITGKLIDKFSFDMLYDERYFISLLFYLGLLTIDRPIKFWLSFKIPNYVIKTVFWEYFTEQLAKEYQINFGSNEI